MSKMDLHDSTFTYCMMDKRIARQFFLQYLPENILSQIDLTTLAKLRHIRMRASWMICL